jgi:hypothetical protein
VGRARRHQPLAAVDLVVADDVANAVGKYLRATAGQRVHTCRLEPQERLLDRHFAELGEERHLNHGEGLDMHLGEAQLEPANQVLEVFKRQIGMQSSDDVELGDRLAEPGARRLPCLFQRHGVGAGRALFAPKGAEPATGHAYIGGVDVPVHVEVGDVSMPALAHDVGHPTDGQDVWSAIERDAVVEAEPLARRNFGRNRQQQWVSGLEAVVRTGNERTHADPILI